MYSCKRPGRSDCIRMASSNGPDKRPVPAGRFALGARRRAGCSPHGLLSISDPNVPFPLIVRYGQERTMPTVVGSLEPGSATNTLGVEPGWIHKQKALLDDLARMALEPLPPTFWAPGVEETLEMLNEHDSPVLIPR